MKYIPVIGLEVHVELNTKLKMFCSCPSDYFGMKPNTLTCPICLGLPGALPYTNGAALEKCVALGLALRCSVNLQSKFERKNYFYPDLPKGYQISQYRWPLCVFGSHELKSGKIIKINRVHQEEDTAKLINTSWGTGIDFNRSGVPLAEIVTEPDFDNVAEVVEFAKYLHLTVKDLGISNADMERGDLRLEANISMRAEGQSELPDYRIELKNINSFRFMQKALEHEIKRQTRALENGEILTHETRGWREEDGVSFSQRSKEEAHDYRYFPEPDIPEIIFTEAQIKKIRNKMPLSASDRIKDIVDKHKIPMEYARIIDSRKQASILSDMSSKHVGLKGIELAKLIINRPARSKISLDDYIENYLSSRLDENEIEGGILIKLVDEVIDEYPEAAANYKKGNENSIQFLVGQVMSKSKGKANAVSSLQLLKDKLS